MTWHENNHFSLFWNSYGSCASWWWCQSMVEIREQQLPQWTNFTAWLFDRWPGLVHRNHAKSSHQTRMWNMCDERSKRNWFYEIADDIAADIPRQKCINGKFIFYAPQIPIESHLFSICRIFQIVNIFTVLDFSGRIDHILSQINTLHKAADLVIGIDLYLLTKNSVSWLLQPGQHCIRIPDRFVADKYWCSHVPVGSRCCVTTSGLKWDLGEQNFMQLGRDFLLMHTLY